jgi:hypothetical protein
LEFIQPRRLFFSFALVLLSAFEPVERIFREFLRFLLVLELDGL